MHPKQTGTDNSVPVLSSSLGKRALGLLSESESLDDSSVSLDILLHKVSKKLLSVTNHLGKSSLRMEVLGVLLHVLGEGVNSIGKDSDLYLGRTGVILIDLVLSDEGGLCFL